jgi:MFS family permease
MERQNESAARSVQEYIDETPVWADGTAVPSSPMTRMQWRIFTLACAGKFFEGMVVFMTGVALPLISRQFGLDATAKGFVTAATLGGILVGASLLGGLADTFGRKKMFIVEMVLFTLFLVALTLAPTFPCLVIFLFGAGLALGCDYPTAHMVISESIPTNVRGRLVLSAFAFQAVGALVGSAVGYAILKGNASLDAWRWMYACAILPAVGVIIGRFFITDSPHWLASRGRIAQAERETLRLLKRTPPYPKAVTLRRESQPDRPARPVRYAALLSRAHRRATILAAVPWFLQDLGTYGIGIFTPTILAAMLGSKTASRTLADVVHNDMLAAKGSAVMDLFFFAGIIVAILLVDRIGRIKLQIVGFVGCAVGLLLAALSIRSDGSNDMALLLVGFVLFYFMTNLGPNAMTYLLSGEVFPTRVRGRGAGFAASFAKIGAVTTAFLFPELLQLIGTANLLYILVGTSLLGAAITLIFAIETRGVSLEAIGQAVRDEEIIQERQADADIL